MNDAHFHLVVNHLPIIFPLVGAIVLATGLISKSDGAKRSAFMIFILGAVAAIFAMNSGEGAEEIVENISGISENFIKTHEEAAETFALLSYVLGGLSVLSLWASFTKKSFSNIVSIATLLFALVVLFFAKETGTTGGEIRHTEIRTDFNATSTEKNNTENGEAAKNDND